MSVYAKLAGMNPELREYLKQNGSKGGHARVKKTTPEQRRKWGKMGGRPRKKVLDK